MRAVVAEKPSVGRDLARVLGASERGQGFLRGNGWIVTWAVGHLVRLAEPHEIRPEWRRWSPGTLPILPPQWPLVVIEDNRTQFDVVKRILLDREVEEVVCATDAGREGELIFRYLYEAAGCTRPVQRLWISSLTPAAIREGFARLAPGRQFDPLAAAARGRSQADWLVGMNLTRACTLAYGPAMAEGEVLSVGRVQTPTLALLVEREKAIRAFVPEDYLEVSAAFSPREGEAKGARYRGTWFAGTEPTPIARRLPPDGAEAGRVVERARTGHASVESVTAEQGRMPPPLLYDLTELQRHANRLFGFTAARTLQLAQALYERHKLISYPRTDSRHLTQDVAATLPAVVAAISAPYKPLLAPGTGQRPLSRRFVDDAKVTDHHAIIPTLAPAGDVTLDPDLRRLYDLVCRRLLSAWHEDHLFSVTNVITAIRGADVVDRYHSTGTTVDRVGWKVLDPPPARPKKDAGRGEDDDGEDTVLPTGLAAGQAADVMEARAVARKTRPPRRFTEAALLTAMETAGRQLDDKELSQAMKDSGLGTPATRAETIETLLRRSYVERLGKALRATDRGIRLIDVIHPDVKSPAMTARWERELARIHRGEAALGPFMERIEAWVRDVVGETLGAAVAAGPAGPPLRVASAVPATSAPPATRWWEDRPPATAAAPLASARTPTPPGQLVDLLKSAFRLEGFRPYQEAVCRAVTEGKDVLLVMPTGAGKSLCYQLPGLARGGTTLVVAPLIALIEDQVAKLQALGLRAERIHSGRDRARSRQVCLDYLAGRLDFLFIAPERLGVPGFPEMLARRPLALVAVDEAHCISHWGHDFRPDYRMLKERLVSLRPAPVVALTATATTRVQDDIASQLGLARANRFIHGFRRTNIAIEVAEIPPPDRGELVVGLLGDAARRPAIVYAPTRKEAERLALDLRPLKAASYHAGMSAPERDRVQAAFLDGQLEVVVATIAFGMGVDKADIRTVVHTGLPGSVEGYYQEIGRGGRDGKPCRAVLLYSYADRRTHEFFHERDYPEPVVLAEVLAALKGEPQALADVRHRSRMDPDVWDRAFDKLRIHGGARLGPQDSVSRGIAAWREPYVQQREHKKAQLDAIFRYAESHGCRMLSMVRHFGDQADTGKACGTCDVCAPEGCRARPFRAPRAGEVRLLEAILARLRQGDGIGVGRLSQEAAPGADRREFESALGGLARAGFVRLAQEEFEKDGKVVKYQRVTLTAEGRDTTDVAEHVQVTGKSAPAPRGRKGLARAGPPRLAKPTRKRGSAARGASGTVAGRRPPAPRERQPPSTTKDADLVARVKAWRLDEARARNVPAFHILTDRTLMAIAEGEPRDLRSLRAIHGIGPQIAERYGRVLLALVGRKNVQT